MSVAAAELQRFGGRLGWRRAATALAVVVALALGSWAWQPAPPDPDAGLFRVAGDGILMDAAASDARFAIVADAPWDLFIDDADVHHADTERGAAAHEAFAIAVRTWQDARLRDEVDQEAAFPVTISVLHQPRVVPAGPAPEAPASGPPAPVPDGAPGVIQDAPDAADATSELRPDEVDPPFPIRSLLLTFAYILPASFLAQIHGANLHGERTRHRGVLLLSAPVSPARILFGKSAPALGATMAISAAVTLWLEAGLAGFIASLVILFFLLAATSFTALIARSPREMGLMQVAVTTLLNVFLFLPAMFPSLPPVAFLSPVHVIASGIRGDVVTLGQWLYATLPLTAAAIGLIALSIGLLRDELLFSVEGPHRRLLGALGAVARGSKGAFAAGALVVPFVFAFQILVLVVVAVVGLEAAFILWLPLSALAEEAAKALPIWSRNRPPWRTGLVVGAGFFLAEKGYLVLTLVGFRSLPFGDEALALLGTGPGIALLLLPLALHVATATLLAWGRARHWGVLAFMAATAVHLGYDQLLLGGIT